MTLSPNPSEDSAGRQPSPIDVSVGLTMRKRRKAIGMSQEQLADKLGLTFQQIQKYERGANRVSASKLYEAARALRLPISHFFANLPDPTEDGAEVLPGDQPDAFLAMAGMPYGPAIAADFNRISNLDRALLAGLARRFAEGAGDLPQALDVGMGAAELVETIEDNSRRIAAKINTGQGGWPQDRRVA